MRVLEISSFVQLILVFHQTQRVLFDLTQKKYRVLLCVVFTLMKTLLNRTWTSYLGTLSIER